MAGRLVLLVCKFPSEKKMAEVPKPFKLWFDEELAHFGVDFTIDECVCPIALTRHCKLFMEMAFCVVVQRRNIMTSYPSSYEHVVVRGISWLI
jgi:hypothetical protein